MSKTKVSSSSSTLNSKIVLLGTSSVGKSCLMKRYIEDSFETTAATIGAASVEKTVTNSKGQELHLSIWDTAGQERYKSLSSFYCRGATCALICFDISSPNTFKDVDKWTETFWASSPAENSFVVLVGTKKDNATKENQVDTDDAEKAVKRRGFEAYFSTSAKTGDGIQDLFGFIVDRLFEAASQSEQNSSMDANRVHMGGGRQKKNKSSCCK
eukprot:gb/GECH01004810.1/.p1 GENE.gb/GECH01004810.1/~~gb/GECH01004810.1/.p1  ORF type:complete len:213 (+),score=43.80 gb/GECH01004810.1/:1-639(+)